MELITKQGFKQTELGLIPEDWEVSQIGDKIQLLAGFPFPSNKYSDDGIRLLKGINIKRGNTDWREGNVTFWKEDIFKYKEYQLAENDLVIAMDGSLVGRSYAFISKSDLPALLLQRVARLRSNSLSVEYLRFFIGSNWFIKYTDSVKTVTAIPHISPKDIRNFKIPLPPTLTEQKAIATALSDVDALITSLEQTITKKKAIKQGAMQQLLTPPHKGGKRLPGFEGEWVEKTLGECLKYEQPTKYIVENSDYEGQSQTPVLTAGKSFLLGYTDEEFGVYSDYPVIIFDDFTTSKQFVDFSFKVKSSAMKLLKPVSDEIDINFMFSIMNLIRFSLGDDHKRRWIAEYSKIEIFMPHIKEQKAIAQILSDMDAEITQLETKKEKYQAIKQGMMQELLTGKTRLV
jgi:type I restriction enzyme S subunit